MSSCGGTKDDRTISTFTKAFENAGITMENPDKSLFEMVGATDRTMFYIDGQPVKIFMYESIDKLKQAQKDYGDMLKSFVLNGKFLLDTSNKKAIEIYKGVTQ